MLTALFIALHYPSGTEIMLVEFKDCYALMPRQGCSHHCHVLDADSCESEDYSAWSYQTLKLHTKVIKFENLHAKCLFFIATIQLVYLVSSHSHTASDRLWRGIKMVGYG